MDSQPLMHHNIQYIGVPHWLEINNANMCSQFFDCFLSHFPFLSRCMACVLVKHGLRQKRLTKRFIECIRTHTQINWNGFDSKRNWSMTFHIKSIEFNFELIRKFSNDLFNHLSVCLSACISKCYDLKMWFRKKKKIIASTENLFG